MSIFVKKEIFKSYHNESIKLGDVISLTDDNELYFIITNFDGIFVTGVYICKESGYECDNIIITKLIEDKDVFIIENLSERLKQWN